jgi:hypothetical protein
MTDFATLSRSSSVSVRSRGWMMISMATDFLPSPSDGAFEQVEDVDAGDQLLVGAVDGAHQRGGRHILSTTKAKSRRTAWKAESSSTGLVRVALRFLRESRR